MKNYKRRVILKSTYILVCIDLIAIAIVVFVGILIIQSNIISLKPYLEFHVSKNLLLLLLGSILLIGTAFLGILSGIYNWRAGLKTFVIFIFCLFISMIALCVEFYYTSKTADDAMLCRLIKHTQNHSIYSYELNNIQLHLSCCGVNNFTDWNKTLAFIPGSCCNSNTICNSHNVYRDGCYGALKAFLNNYIEKIIIVLIIIGLLEIVSVVLSLFVIRSLENKGHDESLETDKQKIEDGESVRIPRINNSSGQLTHDTNINSLSSVIENAAKDNYHLSRNNNYVRRPCQRNIIVNYRNRHENYLRSPPQQRYDRRIFQSIPKLMNSSNFNFQK